MPRVNKVHDRLETTGTECNLGAQAASLYRAMASHREYLTEKEAHVLRHAVEWAEAAEKIIDSRNPAIENARKAKAAASKNGEGDSSGEAPKKRGRPKKADAKS